MFVLFILGSVYSLAIYEWGYYQGVQSSAGFSVGVKEGQVQLFDSLSKIPTEKVKAKGGSK
jgi:hypothetical protein